MAADAPQQGTRRSSRLKVAGRLTALIGVPLFMLFAIFAGGVYFGALRSYRISMLEAEWLGLDPPALPALSGEPPAEPVPDAGTPDPNTPAPDPNTPAPDPNTAKPDPNTAKPDPNTAKPDPNTAKPDTTQPVEAQPGLPVAAAEPIGAELRSRYDEVLVVRVKVMVDPALTVVREDWLSYTASLIQATNASFQWLFGVEVRLQGVVVWNLGQAASPEALLADLSSRERDGADVVLGLVAATAPPGFTPPAWTGDVHGNQALVFADLRQRDRYYLNVLEALATVLGAEHTNDGAAKQLGSFMSDAEPADGAAPVIDPDNRGRVIINKRRPFATGSPPGSPGEPDDGAQPAGEEI